MKKWAALMLALLLSFCMTACGGGETASSGQMEPSSEVSELLEDSSASITGMQIGETGTSISAEATVTGAGFLEDEIPSGGGKYCYVDITIKNVSKSAYLIEEFKRFFLLNPQREKINVESFADTEGNTVKSLAAGEEISGRAIFAVPADFTVAAVMFSYDYMGFGNYIWLLF